MKKLQNALLFFASFLCVYLGVVGILEGFFSYLPLSVQKEHLYAGAFFCCLLFSLIFDCNLGKKRIPLLAGMFLCLILLVFWKRDVVLGSFYGILQTIAEKVTETYQMQIILSPLQGVKPGEAAGGLWVIIVFLSLWFSYSVLGGRGRGITGILCLLPVLGGLFFNTVPSVRACICLLLSFLGTMAVSSYTLEEEGSLQKKAALIMLVMGSVTALTAFWITGQTEGQFQESNLRLRAHIEETLWPKMSRVEEWFSLGRSAGGVQSGELNRQESVTYTGARALEVTTEEKPDRAVYLRGFVGDVYTGKAWEPVSEDKLLSYGRDMFWEIDENEKMRIFNLGHVLGQMRRGQTKEHSQEYKIRRITAGKAYTYIPYGALLEEPLSMDGDGAVAGTGKKEYSFVCYPPLQDLSQGVANYAFPGPGWDSVYQQYSAYVHNAYLDYPEELLPNLVQECREQPIYSLEGIVNHICEALASASYNLSAAPCPEGKEFTEYFLYESREGYCVHFATAATLMFRMYGIPARYATGYIAPASSFQMNVSGTYTAVVEDRKAHAWAEIYVPSAGWIPIETTPGYQGPQQFQSSAPEENVQETPSGSVPEPTPVGEDGDDYQTTAPTASPDQSAPGGKNEGSLTSIGSYVMKVLGVLLLILAIPLFLLTYRGIRLAIHRRWLRTSPDAAIRYLFTRTRQAMKAAGIDQDNLTDARQYTELLQTHCPALSSQTLEAYVDQAFAAAFSNRTFTPGETKTAVCTYTQICRTLYLALTPLQKFKYRFWYVFF